MNKEIKKNYKLLLNIFDLIKIEILNTNNIDLLHNLNIIRFKYNYYCHEIGLYNRLYNIKCDLDLFKKYLIDLNDYNNSNMNNLINALDLFLLK